MNFAKLIKEARKDKGVSLSQAAAGSGISKPHIWDLETGRQNNPTIRTFGILCDYYKIDKKKVICLVC